MLNNIGNFSFDLANPKFCFYLIYFDKNCFLNNIFTIKSFKSISSLLSLNVTTKATSTLSKFLPLSTFLPKFIARLFKVNLILEVLKFQCKKEFLVMIITCEDVLGFPWSFFIIHQPITIQMQENREHNAHETQEIRSEAREKPTRGKSGQSIPYRSFVNKRNPSHTNQ